jgi:uncharacterized protein
VQATRVVEALRRVLGARDVPPHRIELAARAVVTLLERTVDVRPDGGVFVSTGDIPAMWLRDSAAQVAPLLALRDEAPEVVDLVAGVLRLQVELVLSDRRANAFAEGRRVFERKYEVDSLCAPLRLAWLLREATGSLAHVDERFLAAARSVLELWRLEQRHERGSYRHRRLGRPRGTLSHRGYGAPFAPTGMTWTAFRPSDDGCRYPFNVPQNAFAAASLERLAALDTQRIAEPVDLVRVDAVDDCVRLDSGP